MKDATGYELSGAKGSSAEILEQGLREFRCYIGDPVATVNRALDGSPELVMGHVLKAYLPTLLVLRSMGLLPALVTGFAVVLGHAFSPFLGGRGGKGVACALGAILAVAPWVALGAVVVFGLAMTGVTHVGEASVVVTAALVVLGALAGLGLVPWLEPAVAEGW